MRAEATTNPVSAQAANALALHLRRNPDDAMRSPADLAAQFDLSPTFVESVLLGIREASAQAPSEKIHVNLSFVARAYQTASSFFDGLTSRPALFIPVSLAVAFALGYVAERALPASPIREIVAPVPPQNAAVFLIGLATFTLHMACYYRNRMGRYALYGGLWLWIATSGMSLATSAWRNVMRPGLTPLFAILLVLFGMLMVSLIYSGLGALASVMGGWIHVRRQRRRDELMSRQEMLERYFELQARLQASSAAQTSSDSIFDARLATLFQKYGWAVIVGISLGLHSVTVAIADAAISKGTLNSLLLIASLLQVVFVLCQVAIGFFSRTLWWALVNSLLFSLVGLVPAWVAAKVFGHASVERDLELWNAAGTALFYMGVAVAGGLGATVQRRAARDWSLLQNDPAAILAEMVRLQWRLGDRATEVCVMVVDAAKSAQMKSAADPLAVEYSFREYQEWISTISESCHGKVHSTAGDGAVVSFPSCVQAFLAARRIQTDIDRFNREDNRLSAPFRLRIGLHVGSIAGDLDKIQFTEVIDIAAHVQSVAPISGIVVTSEVAAQIPDETFVPLANPVDGHPVLLALNPTVDE